MSDALKAVLAILGIGAIISIASKSSSNQSSGTESGALPAGYGSHVIEAPANPGVGNSGTISSQMVGAAPFSGPKVTVSTAPASTISLTGTNITVSVPTANNATSTPLLSTAQASQLNQILNAGGPQATALANQVIALANATPANQPIAPNGTTLNTSFSTADVEASLQASGEPVNAQTIAAATSGGLSTAQQYLQQQADFYASTGNQTMANEYKQELQSVVTSQQFAQVLSTDPTFAAI